MANELVKVLWYYNLLPDTQTENQKIVCPFHEDVNPSMIVNLEGNSWFCFGCQMSGDALRFVCLMEEKYNGLNELQACHKYIKILKSKKCSDIKINANRKKYKPSQRDMYAEAYDYYHGLSKVNWANPDIEEAIEAKAYMRDRGFTSSSLKKCKAKITYNNSYPIIFPMLDNKKFKGWVCRTTTKSIEEKRKYLYNKGFSRATTLVGNYGSKNYVFVVEGYMDRLKFIQNGESNVVAILGWKITDQQIQKLKDAGITTIISALDNDQCGRKGTRYLRGFFKVVRFKYIKGIKDPGEMSKTDFNKMYQKTIKSYNEEMEEN